MKLRAILAIAVGKITGRSSRVLGRGGGTAIAGLAALRIDPGIVRRLVGQAGAGAICVTGTNGKTTTSLMLNRIVREAGLRPLHNRSGSNLMRGVAAMLVEEASIAGAIPDASRRLAILEVDEATLPEIVREVAPRAVVFTNLFRDQLDRYGEVDTVAGAWERALGGGRGQVSGVSGQVSGARDLGPGSSDQQVGPTLVLNADDPAVAHLGRAYSGPVLYYGVDDLAASADAVEHASDFRMCLECGNELSYGATFYGHIGHWRCESCGNARPEPNVRATKIAAHGDRTAIDVAMPDGACLRVDLGLSGLYNVYNALAAIAGATALGLPADAITCALADFSAAFGRQERFAIDGRDVRVLLGKNPTGLNQVLRTIAAEPGDKRFLFFLNDGIADGRDISWIWDADYEIAQPECAWVLAAGTRAEDLALRLKYAGFGDDVAIERETVAAVERALGATPAGATLHVIPTYTAMLEVRELLAKRAAQPRFWEDA